MITPLTRITDDWNRQHPVGTAVSLTNGLGIVNHTVTTSPAMIFAKSEVLIWIRGVFHPVNLNRLSVTNNIETQNAQ